MVRASMDAECNVSMDAHAPLGMPGLAGKLTVHQGKNDLIQGTALLLGEEVRDGQQAAFSFLFVFFRLFVALLLLLLLYF